MKLQIAFDIPDLEKAVALASQVERYADIIELGTLLLYKHGARAVERFREALPKAVILADAKIIDRGKDSVTMFASAGADWVTVMAGTSAEVIHSACTTAHQLGRKVMLDLVDSSSVGQSALEAKNLGVDALLFHQPYDVKDALLMFDKWDMVRGNSPLPIYVAAKINRDTIENVIAIKPDGIVVGRAIVEADDPAAEAEFFAQVAQR